MKRFASIALVIVVALTLTACQQDVSFVLIGEDIVNMTLDEGYIEKGFMAHDGREDISDLVEMSGNINPEEAGDYEVNYVLEYQGETYELTRKVYYREEGCTVLPDSDITECEIFWTQYLHTVVKLRVYYQGDSHHGAIRHIFDNVELLLHNYHQLSDKYNAYDNVVNINTINADPTSTHVIEPGLFNMIEFALDHQDEVNNLFNIALNPVLEIWHDHREACNTYDNPVCEVPSMTELELMDLYTDPGGITMNAEASTITMLPNMSIDLGGMSKGYISGLLIEYLDSQNLYAYLLNNGESNISIGGTHPTRENGKFLLAITDPTFETSYYATVYLGAGDQLVTSGDYQQYYEVDGEIYHHIINPNTLMPERYSRSVSIITDDPALADIYSTAIFTMTLEDGLAFVNGIDNLEAIWYTIDDQIVFSDGFEAQYLDDTYK